VAALLLVPSGTIDLFTYVPEYQVLYTPVDAGKRANSTKGVQARFNPITKTETKTKTKTNVKIRIQKREEKRREEKRYNPYK
jgi:hypothetical protein